MDAFALARAAARRRRASLPNGIVSAYAAVEHALADAGLAIRPLKRDGVLLDGSDAKLQRDFSRVLVRDDVPRAEQAVLAAHELGHFDLHKPHEVCELDHTDLGGRLRARKPGSKPNGPRERRELQANVYAREFLLPRDLARRLFLEDRLPATEIAARLDLPPSMVRQQLFEALLRLDIMPDAGKPVAASGKLDPSQAKAVGHDGRALLVEAGPGSGKTKTLVARVGRLLETTHPSAVLALTFSNKAAAELSSRVVAAHGDAAGEVWTGTFHAFGLE